MSLFCVICSNPSIHPREEWTRIYVQFPKPRCHQKTTSVFLASALLRGADFLVYFATKQLRHEISETSDVSTGVFVANSTTGHELRAAEGGAKMFFDPSVNKDLLK
jgi:hypothetical protein